jgi:hypothetical protein
MSRAEYAIQANPTIGTMPDASLQALAEVLGVVIERQRASHASEVYADVQQRAVRKLVIADVVESEPALPMGKGSRFASN